MRTISFFLFFICSAVCYPQDFIIDNNIYEGILSNLYVNHQPSVKSEAMGKGLVANSDGRFGSYYNPALTSLNEGFNFDYSYSQSEGGKPSFSYYGISYTSEKLGSIGVNAYYNSKPHENSVGFRVQQKYSYYDALYNINYSRQILKNFYAGVNLGVFHYYNYYHWLAAYGYQGAFFIADGVTLDLGLLKKFELETSENKQIFQIGVALYNVTNSKIGENYKQPLPVTFRIGASHHLIIENGIKKAVPYPLSFFTHIEFEKIINSEYYGTFKVGEELSLWNILNLRAGYFYSDVEGNREYYISEVTCGLGLDIPLNKLFKIKNALSLKIDYASFDLKNYSRYDYYDYSKYNTLALSINYVP